jgi:hypothetical protein
LRTSNATAAAAAAAATATAAGDGLTTAYDHDYAAASGGAGSAGVVDASMALDAFGGGGGGGGGAGRDRLRALLAQMPHGTILVPSASSSSSLSFSSSSAVTSRRSFSLAVQNLLLYSLFLLSIHAPWLRNRRATPRRRRALVFAVAALAAVLVTCDAVASFAVVAQALACNASRLALVLLLPPMALPAAPLAGRVGTSHHAIIVRQSTVQLMTANMVPM